MARHAIHATALVRCPFSVASEMIERALQDRREITVSAGHGLRERVRIGWAVVDDLSDECRSHDAVAIYWTPRHKTFPTFAGTITVRPHFRDVYIRITGHYEPPLGATGRFFDRIAGRQIARVTLHRLLRELARDVESRYLVYLQEIGAAGTHRHTGRKGDEILGSDESGLGHALLGHVEQDVDRRVAVDQE